MRAGAAGTQALVRLRKLSQLEGWNASRRAAVAYYLEALDGVGDLLLPPVAPASKPSNTCSSCAAPGTSSRSS